jgi:hypothetical protein
VNEVSPELLEQLRDIHSAVEPGWWPPAPGWWLIAAVLLVLLMLLMRQLSRRWAIRRRQAKLLTALEYIQSHFDPAESASEYLSQLNRLFRVIAIRAFPDTASARLQGSAWVDFLRSLLPDGPAAQSLAALESGPYQPEPEFDAVALHAMAKEWVKRYG